MPPLPPVPAADPIGLTVTDPALAGTLAGAAAAQGILLSADGDRLLQLAQQDRALHLSRDGAVLETFALPARLGAIFDALRQAGRQVPALALAGGLRLDRQGRRLELADGASVPLTEKEGEILAYLATAASADRPAPRAALMDAVWGYSPEADTHTLETHVYRLRQKLEAAGVPALLLTGEGGYHLAQD